MKKLAVALLLATACSGSSTSSVRVTVHVAPDLAVTGFEIKIGDKDAKTTSGDTLVVLVPDAWAGTSMPIDVWGLHDDNRVAHGRSQVTPLLSQQVTVDMTLLQLPCGAWCTVGATTCVGDGTAVCTQRASDQCLEWSATTSCGAATPYCSFGECAKTCIDECALGDARCDGPGAFRICGQTDSDSCNDWLPAIACASGETCSNGRCSTTCHDECKTGDKDCLGAGARVCADRDGDGCLEWGPIAPCATGETCNAGVCGHASCTDECTGTAKTCDGDVLKTCGNYDLDSCSELSSGSSCSSNDPCMTGACTASGCAVTPKTCTQPPASSCVDANTMKVYDAVGTCSAGDCGYVAHDVACTNCPACDACAGVTCDKPPSPCFASTGTCSGGSCTYAYANGATCDDKNACTTNDTCNMGMCAGTAVTCTDASVCSKGSCDASSGACVQKAQNETMACTTNGDAGTCMAGTCDATPTCAPAATPPSIIYCDPGVFSIGNGNNATTSVGQAVVNSYGCAPNEAGPEVAYEFVHDTTAGTEDITITLHLTNPDGTIAASQTAVDLDLIVLKGGCTSASTCVNPTVTGGYQGVTAGTSAETVKFSADATSTYYVVVDSKNATQTHDFVVEVVSCGRCQPSDTSTFDCNLSLSITSGTANGAASLTNYMCTSAKTAVTSAGDEVPYYLKVLGSVARNVTATLTGATPAAALKLLALPESFWGECDPTACVESGDASSGTTSITWATAPTTADFSRYFLVVDAAGATNSSYGLQIACALPCQTAAMALSCAGAIDVKTVTSTTVAGPTQATQYGPSTGCDALTGLTGPEEGIRFTTLSTTAKTYELRLSSTTVGKSLSFTILDGGLQSDLTCDPKMACVANTVQTGTGYSGTRTTGTGLMAVTRFLAQPGHTYFVMVDGTDAAGAAFTMTAVGIDTGAGCAP